MLGTLDTVDTYLGGTDCTVPSLSNQPRTLSHIATLFYSGCINSSAYPQLISI